MDQGSLSGRRRRGERHSGLRLGLGTAGSTAGGSHGTSGYGPSGFGPPPSDPQQLAGQDVEYRLSREFRKPLVPRLIISLILMGFMAGAFASPLAGLAALVFLVSALVAVWCGAAYLWRGRFRTTVTGRGVEMRGYFNHFVPWDEVRGIEIGGYGSPRMRLDDTFRPQIRVTRRGYRPDTRSTSGKMARLATIKIVRKNGRKLMLRAPIVTGWASDPYFSDKARQLQELCTMYAGPVELRSVRRR